jgi:hypothetical protein
MDVIMARSRQKITSEDVIIGYLLHGDTSIAVLRRSELTVITPTDVISTQILHSDTAEDVNIAWR